MNQTTTKREVDSRALNEEESKRRCRQVTQEDEPRSSSDPGSGLEASSRSQCRSTVGGTTGLSSESQLLSIRVENGERDAITGHVVVQVPYACCRATTIMDVVIQAYTQERSNGTSLLSPCPKDYEWLSDIRLVDDFTATFTEGRMEAVTIADLVEKYGARRNLTIRVRFIPAEYHSETVSQMLLRSI